MTIFYLLLRFQFFTSFKADFTIVCPGIVFLTPALRVHRNLWFALTWYISSVLGKLISVFSNINLLYILLSYFSDHSYIYVKPFIPLCSFIFFVLCTWICKLFIDHYLIYYYFLLLVILHCYNKFIKLLCLL